MVLGVGSGGAVVPNTKVAGNSPQDFELLSGDDEQRYAAKRSVISPIRSNPETRPRHCVVTDEPANKLFISSTRTRSGQSAPGGGVSARRCS
jgi:hypothetical protein